MTVKIKDVYAVTKRRDGDKTSWARVGVAFVNKDDSINVILDALPVEGRLNIRDRVLKQQNQNQLIKEIA